MSKKRERISKVKNSEEKKYKVIRYPEDWETVIDKNAVTIMVEVNSSDFVRRIAIQSYLAYFTNMYVLSNGRVHSLLYCDVLGEFTGGLLAESVRGLLSTVRIEGAPVHLYVAGDALNYLLPLASDTVQIISPK